jgi:hypothetical protein
MKISIGRTIFVALIALSVAMLPAAVGFAAGGKTMGMSASGTMPDWDHHHHNMPSEKTQKTEDDGACMAACATACFGFATTEFSDITISSPLSSALKRVRASDNVSSHLGNLPFRPPRA